MCHLLKENTTIQNVTLVAEDDKNGRSRWGTRRHHLRHDGMEYYLKLNRCHRKECQDPATSLTELVSYLGSVDAEMTGRRKERIGTSVKYELLRLAVHKWATEQN